MNEVVLDASALIALLRAEPGAAEVEAVLDTARISVVNLAEVVGYLLYNGVPSHEADAILERLPLTIVIADDALAWSVGRPRPATAKAGLSLGDRFCLALAARDRLPAWTADRQWLTIAEAAGVEVHLIR